jgi:hypothetical protein
MQTGGEKMSWGFPPKILIDGRAAVPVGIKTEEGETVFTAKSNVEVTS